MANGTLVDDAVKRLTGWITLTRLKPGERLPSERSLARSLDIGHYALNRAMARCIAEGRVQRQGYKLFLAPPESRPPSTRTSCRLVIARRSEYISSYRRCAQQLEIDLTVQTWEAAEECAAILRQLEREPPDGILCATPASPAQASWIQPALRLTRRGVPVVCTAWATDDLSSVTTNTTHGLELAINHLSELGHRELAFVTSPFVTARGGDTSDTWKSLCGRMRLHSSENRIRVDSSWLANRDEISRLADHLTGPWKDVTALVVRVSYACAMHLLLAELARRGRRVPESLSIFAVGNSRSLTTAQPRVTSASTDVDLWHEMTFDLLLREIRKHRRLGVVPSPSIVQVMPRLNLRESTAPHGEAARTLPRPSAILGDDAARRAKAAQELEQKARQPYSLAAKASLSERPRFVPLDLHPFVNRPLNFRRGWLGDLPLRCLPPGRQEFHGVPFDILGGDTRADLGAVVFQSGANSTGNAAPLPARLEIPLGLRADAIYLLHGCGYAKPQQPFARYVFHRKRGPALTVPLVSLGLVGSEPAEAAAQNANIQDWWSDFPHLDFDHARMVPLLDHSESGLIKRHVFLYTLEWINPDPADPLTHLEIVTDPETPTTLGLLAATVVKPAKG